MALPDVAYLAIGWFSTSRLDRFLHPILYRRFAARGILGRVLGSEMLLLTTTGRRSGKSRTVALFAFADGDSWIVVGSRGGSRRLPAWYRNLTDQPDASVRVRDREIPLRAREVHGDEYEAAFETAARTYPGYRVYRRRSPIHIPILRLEPR
jgi:deazaflavin-dependent oxidoreductase (nitroreductase family)